MGLGGRTRRLERVAFGVWRLAFGEWHVRLVSGWDLLDLWEWEGVPISLTCPKNPIQVRPSAKRQTPNAPALAYRPPALDTINSAFAPYRLMAASRVLRSGVP